MAFLKLPVKVWRWPFPLPEWLRRGPHFLDSLAVGSLRGLSSNINKVSQTCLLSRAASHEYFQAENVEFCFSEVQDCGSTFALLPFNSQALIHHPSCSHRSCWLSRLWPCSGSSHVCLFVGSSVMWFQFSV